MRIFYQNKRRKETICLFKDLKLCKWFSTVPLSWKYKEWEETWEGSWQDFIIPIQE
jgi:hypothetical protein